MMRKNTRKFSRQNLLILLGVFVAVALFSFLVQTVKKPVDAANLNNFDAGYIISDYQMRNYTSMSEAEIQAFLKSKNSCNDTNLNKGSLSPRGYVDAGTKYGVKYNYRMTFDLGNGPTTYYYHVENGHFVCMADESFNGESAAHIIWQAARDYKINPQVLIVLLQKEQGLVTDTWPNSGAQYRSATGYGCPDTAPCSSEYYGFKNQVRKAAEMFNTVLNGGWTNYPLGWNYIQYSPNDCGGSWVNVRNLATSALYRYTPYQPNAGALAAGYGTAYCGAYGNRNFYAYFEDWFGGITSNEGVLPPINIKVVQNDKDIKVTWNAPSDIKRYGEVKYEVVIANDNKEEIKQTVSGDKNEYTFKNVKEGTYIAASVKILTKIGNAHSRVTFNYPVGRLPSAPTGLKVEYADGGMKVTWNKVADTGGLKLLKYEVVIADVDKKEYKMEVDGNSTSAVFFGLPLKEFFAASVKAVNAKGEKHSRITFKIKNYVTFSDTKSIYTGFTDMPSDEISKTAVSWAVNNGITDKNTRFNGEVALTRRQAMVLLWRMVGKPKVSIYTGFTDMPSDEISKTAVSWAVNNGITDKNTRFNGEVALTRRQAMVLMMRFYQML